MRILITFIFLLSINAFANSEYFVCIGIDVDGLEACVNGYLKSNYELVGGIETNIDKGTLYFFQALVK